MSRVLVYGPRKYLNGERLAQILDAAVERLELSAIVVDGEPGVGTFATQWALDRGMPIETVAADRQRYGKTAVAIQLDQLVGTRPDVVIAFPGDDWPTDSLVDKAWQAGLKVFEVDGRARRPRYG